MSETRFSSQITGKFIPKKDENRLSALKIIVDYIHTGN